MNPDLRVIRGDPTPEELGVVTALVAAASSDGPDPTPKIRGGWSDPARRLRRDFTIGPAAWRTSLLR